MKSSLEAPAFNGFFIHEADDSWDRIAFECMAHGVSLPAAVDRGFPRDPGERRMIVGCRDITGSLVWGALAQIGPSRMVPWRTVVRLPRFAGHIPRAAAPSLRETLIQLGRKTRALRLHCEIFEPDSFAREHVIALLRLAGFRLPASSRLYSDTIFIDLRKPEEAILASFHSTGRRHIRALAKHGLRCGLVDDSTLGPRLDALTRETMARTGGQYIETDWASIIAYATREPSRATLIGVFRPDAAGPASIIGYVLGYRHGNVIEYANAASARLSDVRAPLLYAPTWELMRWGKANGAEWFDFGGISAQQRHGPGATAGIADFKLYFAAETTRVGCELVYAPSAGLDAASRFVSTAVSALKAGVSRW